MTVATLTAPQPTRLFPVAATAGITRAPLFAVIGYVLLTFLLFLTWPIDWPIYGSSDWTNLILYVLLCLFVLTVGAVAGSVGQTQLAAPLPAVPLLLVAGAAASAALLVPSSLAYTGRGPWELLDALQNQGDAYRRFQIQLYYGEGQRTFMVAMRFLAGPLMYAVLPLGVIHWRRIGWLGRASVAVAVGCSIVFSIMRGTDKEIADLFVIGLAALLVSMGRAMTLTGGGRSQLARRYWLPAVIGVAFLFVAQGLFTERKDERLGGIENKALVCANNSRICADIDHPVIAWLPLRERFGLSVFILSTSSGYFGLHLALEKPFESSLGVGHSPAALSVYETLTGDERPHTSTYTYRNGTDQWPEESYWSTLITWLANDVGFAGAVAMLAVIGFAWGLWWREAAAGMSDPAAILFVQATTMVFYLPANNQVFGAYEGYSIFFTWLAIWWWHRSNRRVFAALPLSASGPAR